MLFGKGVEPSGSSLLEEAGPQGRALRLTALPCPAHFGLPLTAEALRPASLHSCSVFCLLPLLPAPPPPWWSLSFCNCNQNKQFLPWVAFVRVTNKLRQRCPSEHCQVTMQRPVPSLSTSEAMSTPLSSLFRQPLMHSYRINRRKDS